MLVFRLITQAHLDEAFAFQKAKRPAPGRVPKFLPENRTDWPVPIKVLIVSHAPPGDRLPPCEARYCEVTLSQFQAAYMNKDPPAVEIGQEIGVSYHFSCLSNPSYTPRPYNI